MYSSNQSHPRRWMWVGGQHHVPAALPSAESPGTHCRGSWVDPRAGLNGRGDRKQIVCPPRRFEPRNVQPLR